jgi:Helix-turn-helix domain
MEIAMQFIPHTDIAVNHDVNNTSEICENSRKNSEARTAQQAKANYVRSFIHAETPHRVACRIYATCSDLSNTAFRVYCAFIDHAKEDGTGANPSIEYISQVTGISLRDCKRAIKELAEKGWQVTIRRRRDTATRNAVIPQKAIDAILFEVAGRLAQMPREGKFQTLEVPVTAHQARSAAPDTSTFLKCQNRGLEVPVMSPKQEEQEEDKKSARACVASSMPRPETSHASGRRWQERDPFGINPWQAKEQQDVYLDADFRIQVHGNFEAELQETVGTAGLGLREVLDEAARWVQRAAPPAELKIAVRSQVARQVREAKERACTPVSRGTVSPRPKNRWDEQREREQKLSTAIDDLYAEMKKQGQI